MAGTDAIVGAEDQDIGRSVGKQADTDYTGELIDSGLHIERIADLESMYIEDLIAIVGDEILAQARLATELAQFSCHQFASHRNYFQR
jgi:hypothetical protein